MKIDDFNLPYPNAGHELDYNSRTEYFGFMKYVKKSIENEKVDPFKFFDMLSATYSVLRK